MVWRHDRGVGQSDRTEYPTPSGDSPGTCNSAGAVARTPDFDSLIVDTARQRRQRILRRYLIALKTAIILLVSAALIVGMYPVVLRMQSSHQLESTAHSAQHHVEQWPTSRVKAMLTAAHDYNNRLAHSPQSQLGGTDDAIDNGTLYKTYLSLLDTDDGIMGSVRVPSISVDLPIYHGTSDRVLANGAGHLYGTSLPVGGTSTHAVITGHRGLTDAEMFTRLNEVRKGDNLYLEVLGETLAYRVDRISVINPDDTTLLRITPGEDRLTLMTCTPYGVNTQRLLVSGHRVAYPGAAPDPAAVRDWRRRFVWAVTGIVITAIVALTITYRDGRWHPRRHMRGERTPTL